MLRIAVMLLLLALPGLGFGQDWGAFVNVSSSIGMNASRLCIAEASRGDLGCPTYAPSLTTAGDISVTRNLSAAKFIGDGSLLTGLTSSSPTVTTGLSGSIVYRDGTGLLVANNTFAISSTTGSVSIGGGTPAGLGNNGLFASGNIYATNFTTNGGSFYTNVGTGLQWAALGNSIIGAINSGPVMSFNVSSSEVVRILATGYVGIGTSYPSATLHVNGTLRIADNGTVCDANRLGAMKYNAGAFYICRNTITGWEAVTAGSATATDRIISGTTQAIAYGNTSLSLVTAGTERVVIGTTGGVGIGQQPANGVALAVSGTASITSDSTVSGTLTLSENPNAACSGANINAMKIVNGRIFLCRSIP